MGECGEVYFIMADFNRIFGEKALLCKLRDPLRRTDDGHILHAGKSRFLPGIIVFTVIQAIAGGITLQEGAVMAAALPLLTILRRKIAAVPGKSPAVMKSPVNLHFGARFNPVEKHFVIDIIAVYHVQPEQVRIIFIRPAQESPRSSL